MGAGYRFMAGIAKMRCRFAWSSKRAESTCPHRLFSQGQHTVALNKCWLKYTHLMTWIKQQGKVEEETLELWRRVDWKSKLSGFDSKGSGGLSPIKPLISVCGAVGMRKVMHHSLTLPLRTRFRCSRRFSLQNGMAFP